MTRRRTRRRTPLALAPPAPDRSGTDNGGGAARSRSHSPTRSRLARSTDFALAPLPIAEPISTSLQRRIQAVPMQRPAVAQSRAPRAASCRSCRSCRRPGWRSCRNLNGLSGSMRPRPQSGRASIHANSSVPQQRPPRARNQEEAVRERLGPREVPHLSDRLEHVAGVEPGICCGSFEETRKCLRPCQTSSRRLAQSLRGASGAVR